MTGMLAPGGTARDVVAGWRYVLDAERAGATRVTVGIRVSDSGEEFTVRLRNSIVVVDDGIADDADAVVEVTSAQLAGSGDTVTTIAGDAAAFSRLIGFLDRDLAGFSMHQR
jgi:alkyl sulfatase BDS1-like metallo-beta-lactamase superfamily hydrolase